MSDSEDFFYEHGGWSFDPSKESREDGRRRSAREYARAERWARDAGMEYRWEADWSIGNHRDYYGEDSAYSDREPETCEQVVALLDGEVVASLGCVDDADDNYRRVVEAELADEAMRYAHDDARKLVALQSATRGMR